MNTAPYPLDAPIAPAGKPYRVTAYRQYGCVITKCFVAGDYRWYWQANLVSFFIYHVLDYGCNTWKSDGK